VLRFPSFAVRDQPEVVAAQLKSALSQRKAVEASTA
jgi:hypothetical protein